jgi:O-Antigen ligase
VSRNAAVLKSQPVVRTARVRGAVFTEPSFVGFAAFIAANAGLAILLVRYPSLALVHTSLTAIVGFGFALQGRYAYVAAVAAYISGVEVAYRMIGAPVPYELAKYAITLLFIFSILLMRRSKPHLLALGYFGLLLPSVTMTLLAAGISTSRGLLSSSMSGPLSLMASIWFFSNVKVSREELGNILGAGVAGSLIPAIVALFGILTVEEPIVFNGESNPLMSGGFGPNQVSAVFGLAAFLGFYAFLDTSRSKALKTLLMTLVLLFVSQCILTFSRGGLYDAVGASVLACFYLFRVPRIRKHIVVAVCCLTVILGVVVVPRLNEFTGGMLAGRFENTGLTHRDDIFYSHWNLWMNNFVFGVGPGAIKELSNISTPHTEYIRLLAEHGLFGLSALVLLAIMGLNNFLRSRRPRQKALSTSMMGWALLFMANAGMRIVAPSLIFGFGFVTLAADAIPPTRKRRAVAGASQPRSTSLREGLPTG